MSQVFCSRLNFYKKIMTDAVPPHKTLYRWEKRQSTLDQPSKPTKHGEKDFNLLKLNSLLKVI
jgi:hypothetical protein